MAETETGSFTHTLEQIDEGITEVNNAKGSFSTLAAALAAKQDALTFDTEPTENSTNPVTSDGIFNALANASASSAFDLGTLIPDAANLDDYKTPGSYYVSTPGSAQTLVMCPATYGFRMTVTTLNGSARFVQTITEAIYNSSATTGLNVYKRAFTVRGWGDWYLYTGTVAQPVNTDYEMIDLLHTEPYASNIENGSFNDNDGQPTSRSDRVRCNSFIDIPAGSTKFTVRASIGSENCKFFADMYDSSGQYLYSVTSASDPLTNIAYYNFVDCGTYRAVPATAGKLRIGLRNQAGTNFSPTNLTELKIIFYST